MFCTAETNDITKTNQGIKIYTYEYKIQAVKFASEIGSIEHFIIDTINGQIKNALF